jgi:hypothetical protein
MQEEIVRLFKTLGGIKPVDGVFLPMTEEEVVTIESEQGVTLPEDYREFLQTYGSCIFGELVSFHAVESSPWPVWPFECFYGSKRSVQDLVGALRAFSFDDRISDVMIPIGHDGAGGQVCLGIKGEHRGKMYFWDHDLSWAERDPTKEVFPNTFLIADSFKSFLRSLKIDENT